MFRCFSCKFFVCIYAQICWKLPILEIALRNYVFKQQELHKKIVPEKNLKCKFWIWIANSGGSTVFKLLYNRKNAAKDVLVGNCRPVYLFNVRYSLYFPLFLLLINAMNIIFYKELRFKNDICAFSLFGNWFLILKYYTIFVYYEILTVNFSAAVFIMNKITISLIGRLFSVIVIWLDVIL